MPARGMFPRMKQHLLTFEQGLFLSSTNPPETASIPDVPPSLGVIQWISIIGDGEALEAVQTARGLPGILLHRVRYTSSFPLVMGGENYILLRVPLRRHWTQAHADYLTMLLLPNEVISITGEKGSCLDAERVRMIEEKAVGAHDAGGLFLYLLDRLIDSNLGLFLTLREKTEILSERFDFTSVTSVRSMEQNLNILRRQANRLVNQFQDVLFALSSLGTLQPHPLLPPSGKILHALVEAQNHLDGSMSHLVERHGVLQQQCHFLLQQQTDRRISRLTVLSTIFMPLTLISGIFGMNFKYITGLDWRYGYPLTLASMIVLGIGLWWVMKRKGWW